jgi:hypothetical protein
MKICLQYSNRINLQSAADSYYLISLISYQLIKICLQYSNRINLQSTDDSCNNLITLIYSQLMTVCLLCSNRVNLQSTNESCYNLITLIYSQLMTVCLLCSNRVNLQSTNESLLYSNRINVAAFSLSNEPLKCAITYNSSNNILNPRMFIFPSQNYSFGFCSEIGLKATSVNTEAYCQSLKLQT